MDTPQADPPSQHLNSPTSSQNSPWAKLPADAQKTDLPVLPDFSVVNGVATIKIPDDILLNGDLLWKKFVVGYFIGDAPHIGTIHATVNRIWNVSGSKEKFDVQFIDKNIVLIRIENDSTRSRIIRRKYWHISDVPLVINEWSPESALNPPDLTGMPLWVDFRKVPSYLYSEKGLICLAETTGSFVRLHPTTEKCTRLDLARVLVEVNLHKQLTEVINFPGLDGVNVSVDVSYPWLPLKCGICRRWGHVGKDCKTGKVTILAQQKDASTSTVSSAIAHEVVNQMITELQNLKPSTESTLETPHYDTPTTTTNSKGGEEDNSRSSSQKVDGENWTIVGRTDQPLTTESSLPLLEVCPESASPSRFQILDTIDEEGKNSEDEADGNVTEKEEGEFVEEATVTKESDQTLKDGDLAADQTGKSSTSDFKDSTQKQKSAKKKTTTLRDLKLQNNHQGTKRSSGRKI